ncbi:hypothetical protein EJC49_00330 [Aquibium carbonis]|uniref:Uncharacterized protein n=1 Tax=Aquibium carbonis TaxID=2495581 RepID=A0A3S0GC84_9HYPH|nr:hypothetical protein [Aquibium carbonis]RST88489.1 hypothetical protein EJC49_00330 [Aquibium carbonis]
MNFLGRITARWLVGLLAILTVLAHVADAGRTAGSGYNLGQPVLSSGDHADPVLVSNGPQVDLRLRAGDTQPPPDGSSADDAMLSARRGFIPTGKGRIARFVGTVPSVRRASFVPGQRAPPTVFSRA